jgi:type IV secretion/conjugal transfer VirB4 family ATPase
VFLRKEFRTEPKRLADHLLWSTLVYGPDTPPARGQAPTTPTVVRNKDGSLMSTLAYRGPDVTMLDYAQWCVYLEGWNRLLKRLGSGWALWADEWHEPSTAYAQSPWSNPVGYFVDNVRKTLFESGQLYETRHYLTLTWQPPSARQRYWLDTIFVHRAMTRATSEDAQQLAQFVGAMEKFADQLSHLMPECHWCTPAQTVSYLHHTVSWDRHQVGVPEIPEFLDMRLTNARFTHGTTPRLGERLLRPIGIRSWPGALGITVPATLQQLPFPYRFTVRYICLDTATAKRTLNGIRRRWEVQVLPIWTHIADAWNGTKTDWQDPTANVNEEAREHAYALQRAVASLASEEIAYGYCSPTILLWGDTEQELAARERAVIKLLQQDEFILEAETVNASRAWLSTLPGDAYSNVRNPLLPTRAFAFLLPHAATWGGPTWDPQFGGPPLFTASSNGQPFRYVLHQGEIGNTMILGPSRSGKSGLLGLMGMQALRYPRAQVFAFDRDFSLYCATLMAGGSHYNLGGNAQRGFQPLGHLERGEAEMRWAQEWLQDLLTAEDVPPTPEERGEIWAALERVADQPPAERRLSLFARFVQVQRLKHALEPYLEGERFDFFDAAADSFALGDVWTTFEMGALLEMPTIVPHALAYVFHQMERCFTGQPVLILLDEAWQFMRHSAFWPKIALWLKAKAKQNVSVVLSSQEVADARQTELWQALQGSVRTWVFLPNNRALNEDVRPQYAACGLTEAQMSLLAMAQEHRDYLYKSEEGTRMFQLRLTDIERCLVAASRPDEIRALRALAEGPQTEPLPAAWLRQQGQDEAADLYVEHLDTAHQAEEAA